MNFGSIKMLEMITRRRRGTKDRSGSSNKRNLKKNNCATN